MIEDAKELLIIVGTACAITFGVGITLIVLSVIANTIFG